MGKQAEETPLVVVHFGQSARSRGGMRTVQDLFLRGGVPGVEQRLFPVYEGSALRTFLLFPFRLLKAAAMRKENVVAQLHTAEKGSFWRKWTISRILRARGIPYVVHLHGANFDDFFEASSPAAKRRIAEFFEQAACAVALSGSWKSWLEANVSRTANVAVVENPCERVVDPPPARSGKGPAKILYAGIVGERKGAFDLARAFAKGNLRDVARLEFCGNGEVEALRAKVSELGLATSVSVAGWTPHDEMLRKMEEADVFVLPSYAEGLPMVVLEAMGSALPVVSTRVGGIPEAVEDGKTGILVEPGDVECLAAAMRALAEDPELRARMGAAGLARVREKFSLEGFFAKFRRIWFEAAGQEPGGAESA